MTDRDGEDQAFVDAISEWPDINDGPPTLAGFLLARITEDEAVAGDMQHQERMGRPLLQLLGGGTGIRRLVDPAHILAECEAKRRIVQAWADVPDEDDPYCRQVHETIGHVFRCLALPYADHPDYRPEWRP